MANDPLKPGLVRALTCADANHVISIAKNLSSYERNPMAHPSWMIAHTGNCLKRLNAYDQDFAHAYAAGHAEGYREATEDLKTGTAPTPPTTLGVYRRDAEEARVRKSLTVFCVSLLITSLVILFAYAFGQVVGAANMAKADQSISQDKK